MTPQTPGADGGARIQGAALHAASAGPGPQLMTAATLAGDLVVNRSGQTLGEIEEIMLDVPRGRIAYVVMAAGGMLGLGRKLFAIPWHALVLDTDRRCFILDVAAERFHDAPGFDPEHWPRQADEQWHLDLHTYYRAPLYWD